MAEDAISSDEEGSGSGKKDWYQVLIRSEKEIEELERRLTQLTVPLRLFMRFSFSFSRPFIYLFILDFALLRRVFSCGFFVFVGSTNHKMPR